MLERITKFSMNHAWLVIFMVMTITAVFALQFSRIKVDTDPENMLEIDQPDRVLYDDVKERFGINELIVAGLEDDQGIFRQEALAAVSRAVTEIIQIKGVIIEDVISLTTTDNVKSAAGFLDIRPVMTSIPSTPEAVDKLKRDIDGNPFLREKISSEDGKATAIYIPIENKDMSYRIAGEVEEILKHHLLEGQKYHVAGLAVAEDTFGHEMFLQMAIVAPLAFIMVLLLVFVLFRTAALLIPVALTAMIAVVWAMGLLTGTGHTVHIMSSMIPVFLMPIAILDDIHILSEFYDGYKNTGDKRRALIESMRPLYKPMLFTSLTSAVGFASLMLADIPPVRVFGLFVAFGIVTAWILTLTLVPAVISLISDKTLQRSIIKRSNNNLSFFDRALRSIGNTAFRRAHAVLIISGLLLSLGAAGLYMIRINDNPVKWFKQSHRLRIADTRMNKLFGGTYMSYIVAEGDTTEAIKRPEVVSYIGKVQSHLETDPAVGKTSSVADIVKRINFVLHDNDSKYHSVPDSKKAVGQFLFLFQSAGDPNDLDNFLDNEARSANIWIQMKSGDNSEMSRIENDLSSYINEHPPPGGLTLKWSGPTYINKVWQGLMVFGMLKAVLGSFLVVFLLMLLEFRSLRLGFLSMVPLTLAIVLSYGLIGWIGKSYDMPIAICSALSLGLAIDFAIHFLQRFRMRYKASGSLEETNKYMFTEPGRAIARNSVVISLGFLPLVFSNLTPYTTVGAFFAMLMIISTFSTMFLLPSFLKIGGDSILQRR